MAEPYRTYSTTGFGVRLDGLLKALSAIRAGEDQSWIQFLRDNVDLRYDYSTFRYGSWGELTPAYVGGYVQPYLGQGTAVDFTGTFESLCFGPANPTPVSNTSWGALKSRYR